jgi:hypothetical protein
MSSGRRKVFERAPIFPGRLPDFVLGVPALF